ncbi:ATP-binding protein [Chloroflexota bacterium]
MEHINEILKRQAAARINTSGKNTGTSSGAETEESAPEPVCPICHGAKFVYPRLPSGKPDYSHVVSCSCALQDSDETRQERMQRYSNLGSLTRFTFDNLLPRGKSQNPTVQEEFHRAYEAARAFATEPVGWLALAGPSGCGKTSLAAAIASYCIVHNRPAFYITAPDLLDRLRATFSPQSEMPYDEFFEQIRNTPLFILDDLGVQSGTPWAKEKLDQLLSHRFSNQLPTVIVSIVPVEDLEERIRTRLLTADLCQAFTIGGESSVRLTSDWTHEFELQKIMTFENFDEKRVNLPLEQRENLRKAFDSARDFAQSPEGWLVFQGDNGCGKTHLAAAVVNYRYQHKKPALFVVVPEFLDHLRYAFSPESKISYDQLFDSVKDASLLVLDDFGKQATTAWAQDKLYQVINYRYNKKLPTVVTTNCSTDELDTPIASRFVDPKISLIFNITAPHYYAGESNQSVVSRSTRKGRWNQTV